MKDGFLSVACGCPRLRLGDCDYNAERSFSMMRAAEKAGVKVLILPELGLTGATCGDLFFQSSLLSGAKTALETVLEATRNLEVVTAIGLPLTVGGSLYNCAALLQRGRLLGVVPKRHISGEQRRYFAPAPLKERHISLAGQENVPFGSGLLFPCENLPELILGVELGDELLSPDAPSFSMAARGATLIGNLAATPELVGRDAYRRQMVSMQSARLLCAYALSSAGEGESSSDAVYGAHQLLAENGRILAQRRFEGGLLSSEIDLQRLRHERLVTQRFPEPAAEEGRLCGGFTLSLHETTLTRYVAPLPFVPEGEAEKKARCQEILFLSALGLKARLEHTGAKTAVIGLSGGLDSTLAVLITALAMKLLGRPMSDICAVTMPCFGTTDRTKNNAVILAEKLGASLKTVDISASVRSHFKDIGQEMSDHSVTFENGQARERTQVLMDLANKLGGIVIGTGDLSELALGWCTYNGDHMSMYAVNAGIPKTLVRHLVSYLAQDSEEQEEDLQEVLEDILDTPVSPELLPAVQGEMGQKTEDLVGPYELHDFFLYHMLRFGDSPKKVYRLACYALGERYSPAVILKWLKVFYRRFFSQQFKRSCLPDGPQVGTICFSPRGAWQMPSDAKWSLWQKELEAL